MTAVNRTFAACLLAATSLIPAPALAQAVAQDATNPAVLAKIEQMQAEIARLSAEVEGLRAQAQATPQAAPVVAANQVSPPVSAPSPAAPNPDSVKIAFKGAPEFSTASGWSFKPRGRIMVDVGTFNAPDSTGRRDGFGSELRRARLGVEGTIPGGFGYKFEYDFAPGESQLADALVTYKDGGLTLTAGQHNNFQSMEELTSSRFTSMIERAAFTDAFGFERRLGLSAQLTSGDLTLQGGVFSDNAATLPGKSWGADGRVVYAPKLDDVQLHLAASVHHYDTAGASVRYRQRPLVHTTSERFLDTGTFSAQGELGIGLEAAIVSGPFHAGAETYWQQVDRPGALVDPTFFGGYAEAGVFLTKGDSRAYKGGTWERVKPAHALGKGGMGALEFNLRYDYLDLNDAGITGGMQRGYMASLVWTPTDYTRLLLNYGHLQYRDAVHAAAGGDRSYGVDSVGLRAQVDF